MFSRYGRVTRVYLAKDRETGRAKGFAFISFEDRTDAARACEKMDGCKFLGDCMYTTYTNSLHSRLWSLDSACGVREEVNLRGGWSVVASWSMIARDEWWNHDATAAVAKSAMIMTGA